MSELARVFSFESQQVRIVVGDDGEPLFRAADVTPHLGLDDTRQAVERLDADEKVKRNTRVVSSTTPPSYEWWVTEAGLYSMVLTSRKPEAERFRRWVTHEVLPSIRKTGSYTAPMTLEQRALAVMAELQAKVAEQSKQIEAAAPKVAFVDEYVDATGLTTLSNAAKELGLGPRKFIGWLCALGAVFHQGGRIVANQGLIERGYFADRTGVASNGHKYGQTYLTAKGMVWVAEKWRMSADSTHLTLAAVQP